MDEYKKFAKVRPLLNILTKNAFDYLIMTNPMFHFMVSLKLNNQSLFLGNHIGWEYEAIYSRKCICPHCLLPQKS